MFGRNDTKTKALAMVLVVAVIFITNAVLPERAVSASPLNRADQAYVIQIEHAWEEPTADGHNLISTLSHGTAINPHTILTHNHFSQPTGAASNETMAFVGADGQAVELASDDFVLEPIDAGTLLIHLPSVVSLYSAPVADRAVVDQLGFGDWLIVNYWDDDASRPMQQGFMIIYVQDGVATLLDPERRINHGDSGSGVFFEGQLVGNIWSIYTILGSTPLGAFKVALLPTQITGQRNQSGGQDTTGSPSDVSAPWDGSGIAQ